MNALSQGAEAAGSMKATLAERLVHTARVAGARRDRAAVLAAAREWVSEQAGHDDWWAGSGQLGVCRLTPIEAGMLLLAAHGPVAAASIGRRLVFVDPDLDGSDRVRLLVDVPPSELSNYGLRNLAWLWLLGSDWRPVPPARPRYGKLFGDGKRGDAVARQVLAAFASRDIASIASAIGSAAAFERSRRFSLFAFALAEEARRIGIEPGLPGYDF